MVHALSKVERIRKENLAAIRFLRRRPSRVTYSPATKEQGLDLGSFVLLRGAINGHKGMRKVQQSTSADTLLHPLREAVAIIGCHSSPPQSLPVHCRFGSDCTRARCLFFHPTRCTGSPLPRGPRIVAGSPGEGRSRSAAGSGRSSPARNFPSTPPLDARVQEWVPQAVRSGSPVLARAAPGGRVILPRVSRNGQLTSHPTSDKQQQLLTPVWIPRDSGVEVDGSIASAPTSASASSGEPASRSPSPLRSGMEPSRGGGGGSRCRRREERAKRRGQTRMVWRKKSHAVAVSTAAHEEEPKPSDAPVGSNDGTEQKRRRENKLPALPHVGGNQPSQKRGDGPAGADAAHGRGGGRQSPPRQQRAPNRNRSPRRGGRRNRGRGKGATRRQPPSYKPFYPRRSQQQQQQQQQAPAHMQVVYYYPPVPVTGGMINAPLFGGNPQQAQHSSHYNAQQPRALYQNQRHNQRHWDGASRGGATPVHYWSQGARPTAVIRTPSMYVTTAGSPGRGN